MKKIAIIGASSGQLPICKKAKEMGLYTICFAWEDGAICKDVVDVFYPISLEEKDRIVEICRQECIDAIVTNASDYTAMVCAYVAEKLGLPTTPFDKLLKIQDKLYVRERTNQLMDLSPIECMKFKVGEYPSFYPCIVKPITGASKKGVSFVENKASFDVAIEYSKKSGAENILVEKYVSGREISVECLSYQGVHYIIQITDKESSGPPHFVELAHHQPAELSPVVNDKIYRTVPQILSAIGFSNGATHIEMKIDDNEKLFLIEVNPRGGGDEISSKLVKLSTNYDYLAGMINVALGNLQKPQIAIRLYAGIYFLCAQTKSRKSYFENSNESPWLIEKKYVPMDTIPEALDNYSRSGYLIYQDKIKIVL